MKLSTVLCAILFVTSFCFAQVKEIPSGNGSISGRVLLEDKPLAGAIVNLQFAENFNSVSLSAKTDSEGKYKFEHVGAGKFIVSPYAPAYAYAEPTAYQPVQGKTVNLANDQTLTEIDLPLKRGGVITGKITDAEGRPVIEQRVQLDLKDEKGTALRRPMSMADWMMSATDDRGIYRIFGLAPGKYLVSVGESDKSPNVSSGLGNKRYQKTYYPGVQNEAEGKLVEVEAGGEAANIDIRLGQEVKAYTVRGRVIDGQTRKPIAGVFVGYGRVEKGSNRMISSASPYEKTPTTGEFILQNVSLGAYQAFLTQNENNEFYSEPTSFEVVDHDLDGIEVIASKGASISGNIILQGVSPQEASTLFNAIFIHFFQRSTNPLPYSPTRPQKDGSFKVSGIPSSSGRFSLGSYNGESRVTLLRVERDGVPIQGEMSVNAGEEINGIRIIAGVGTGTIRGQVIVQGGTIPAGAIMYVMARPIAPNSIGRNVQVDARGTFVLENLMPGEYEIRVNPPIIPGQPPPASWGKNVVKQQVTVNSTGETNVTLTMNLNAQGGNQ